MMMNPRLGLYRQINRRLLLALLLALVFSASVGFWVYQESNSRSLHARLSTLDRHLVTAISRLENSWGREAYNYRARLEYSRLLENPATRADRLIGYLTVQGGSTAFPFMQLLDHDGRLLVEHHYGRNRLPSAQFPEGAEAVWLWDADEKMLFRVFRQQIWLGNENGQLVLFAPIDNALISSFTDPETNTTLFWQDLAVASSKGSDGIVEARASAADRQQMRDRWHVWSEPASESPRLLLLPGRTQTFGAGDLALPLFFATLSFALVTWAILRHWSLVSLARIRAIRHAQEQFAEDRCVDTAVQQALQQANAGIDDEITEVADTLQMMMTSIVSAEFAEMEAARALEHSERRMRLIVEGTHAIAWEYNPARDVFDYVSPQAEAMLGYPASAWCAPDFFSFILPEQEREATLRRRRQAFAADRQETLEYRVRRRDGSLVWLQDLISPLRGEAGEVVRVLGLTLDITERRAAEARRILSDLVVRNTGEGILVTDAENRIISVNPAFERITGYTAAEVLGKNPSLLSSGLQDQAFYQHMWHFLETAGRWSGELWNRRKSGEVYAQRVSIVRIPEGQGHDQSARYIAMFSDITVEKHQAEELAYQAAHDPLTGLPNRRLLGDRMASALARARRKQARFGILVLDLDGFKHINDTLGHSFGDQVLVDTAKRLEHTLRETDTLARIGGDEFVIVVEGLDAEVDLQSIASKILQHIQEPFLIGQSELFITTSIGIAVFPQDGETMDKLFASADTALYRAKGEGRNTFRFFTGEMHDAALLRMETERELRRAVPNQEFVLYYQPVVELATGRIAKAEALVRWQHPTRGVMPPGMFIPIAEDSGLILPLGDWIVGEAARQSAAWSAGNGRNFQICVNFSVHQFHRGDPVTALVEALAESGADSGSIVVEVTESLFMEDDGHCLAQLNELRDKGFAIAIDDFGTGYSSLSYLQRLPVDTIKIDQSFVAGIPDNPRSIALIDAMLSLGRAFNITVIAEGIENEVQATFLCERGCRYGQGFHFGRPMPAAEFTRRYFAPEMA